MPVGSRVVVVGAGGFLGGALVRALRSAGDDVVGVARRAAPGVDVIAPLSELAAHLREGDRVVGAAGLGIKDASGEVALIRGNLELARAMAHAALARGARFVLLSSADLWPLSARRDAREGDEVLPDTAYGLSKLVAENALREPGLRGLSWAVVRPSYVYGPGMYAGRMLPAVMREAPSGHVELKGDEGGLTDYLYVDDFCDGLRHLLERLPFQGETLHLASGRLTRMADAARAMIDALGVRAELRIEGQPGPRQDGAVSIEALRALGFSPRFDVAAGCRAWVQAQGASR